MGCDDCQKSKTFISNLPEKVAKQKSIKTIVKEIKEQRKQGNYNGKTKK
jgi:hypothetical protein